jgi:hypothetical protein
VARARKTEVITQGSKFGLTGPELLALVREATKDVPTEAWAELPEDLSQHFEDYEYGDRPWPTK